MTKGMTKGTIEYMKSIGKDVSGLSSGMKEYMDDLLLTHEERLTMEKGDGDPNCPLCKGKGKITIPKPMGLPASKRCKCCLKKDIIKNLERGWSGLSKVDRIESSPLLEFADKSLWVTGKEKTFREHLRHVALRQKVTWYFKVTGDTKLATAWFANIALKGEKILDPDAASVSLESATLSDLVVPPSLLVIRLGVKAAPMSKMPELLEEAIQEREFAKKPTWVFDQPYHRINNPTHMCYSEGVMDILEYWSHIELEDPDTDTDTNPGFNHFDLPSYNQSSSLPATTVDGTVKTRRTKDKGKKKRK